MSEQIPSQPGGGVSEDIRLLDLALVLAENLRILILVPLIAGLATLGVTFLIKPIYTATTEILPPQYQSSTSAMLLNQLGALASIPGFAFDGKTIGNQYAALIQSRTVADRVIERFGLKALYKKKTLDETRKELASNTAVSLEAKSGLISIKVDDNDPKRAAAVANAYVDELRALTSTLAISEAAQRRLFFEKQVAAEKEKLVNAELAVKASGIGKGTLKVLPNVAVAEVASLKAQIKAQEVRLSVMRTYLTDASPEYRKAQQELTALRDQLGSAAQNDLSNGANSDADYLAKYREFKYHEVLFDQMAKQLELARLDEARDSTAIQVVDLALPPERKSRPKRALITVLVTTASFFLTVLFVLARSGLHGLATDPRAANKLERLRHPFRRHLR